jgi:hypothetical protein
MTEDNIEWSQIASLQGVHLRRTTSLTSSKIRGSSGEVLLTCRGSSITLADGQVLRVDKRFPDRWQLIDSRTGDSVMWICNRHYDRKAHGVRHLLGPGQHPGFQRTQPGSHVSCQGKQPR